MNVLITALCYAVTRLYINNFLLLITALCYAVTRFNSLLPATTRKPYLFVILVSRDCVTVPAVQAMCNRPRRCVSVQGDVPAFKAMCQHSGRCDGVLRQASSAGQVLHASSTMSQMISSTQQNVRSCVSACEVTPLCAPVKSPLGVCLRRCV